MNKNSLEKEFKKLKHYLKKVNEVGNPNSFTQRNIISHTIIGIIMSIHNLINTGAYTQEDNLSDELFSTIEDARHTAVHYGYFNDYNNIYPEAQKIISSIPKEFNTNFASRLNTLEYNEQNTYYQIFPNANIEIKNDFLDGFVTFFNKSNGEMLHIANEDIISVENSFNNSFSYIIKDTEEKQFFYKPNSNEVSEKINFSDLKNLKIFKQFKVSEKRIKLDEIIKKLMESLKEDTYSNMLLTYRYNNKNHSIPVHKILRDFLFERKIDEKILSSKFSLDKYEIENATSIEIGKLSIKDMIKTLSLSDILYIELFLKRYDSYLELQETAKENNLELSTYAKQSLLINLFEVGASSLSDKFIRSDSDFLTLYYEYKKIRNNLAHYAITSNEDKELLISNIEKYSTAFHSIISKIYNSYCKEKSKNPFLKLPQPKDYDGKHYIINNKTNRYLSIKHLGICKIINGKKYLRIDTENKNTYLEVDGSLFLLDYNTLTSRECIIPLEYARFVEIDCNNGKISHSNFKPKNDSIVNVDSFMQTLLQAQDYLKSYPQYDKHASKPHFSAITFFDKFGNPIYTEGLKNLIYRRYSQKIMPINLLQATNLLIPKDIDEPIMILDKEKNPIAKIYLASLNNVNGEETLMQLLKNMTQKEIEYGKLLPKDLKTNQITMTRKEERK